MLRYKPVQSRAKPLKLATLRDFDGGLNKIDTEYNLKPNFSVELYNMFRSPDGSLRTRYGTKLFADLTTTLDGAKIIGMWYFSRAIVVAGANGWLATVNGRGEARTIWNPEIAFGLPDNPAGWSTGLTWANATIFKGELIVVNGIDKPLIVNQFHTTEYLQDLGDLTNINTPIGRYVKSHKRYVLMAGDPSDPDVLHISNFDTSGTWLGDSGTNDAIQVQLGGYVTSGSTEIQGIGSYRDKIVVFFENGFISGTLGIYDSSNNHTPDFDEFVEDYGSMSHRTVQTVGKTMLFSDNAGVSSIERASLNNTLKPERASELIDPLIVKAYSRLTDRARMDDVFAVRDKLEGQYLLFTPKGFDAATAYETEAFAFVYRPQLNVRAWARFGAWRYNCGCRSQEGRMFFAQDQRIFVYGTQAEPFEGDHIDYQETFTDGTDCSDRTGMTPVGTDDKSQNGLPIPFAWETPWIDFGRRTIAKEIKKLWMDTQGEAAFTVECFVDNFYYDRTDLGEAFTDDTIFSDDTGFERENPLLSPQLTKNLVGGDRYGTLYSAERLSNDERGYSFPTRAKIAKLRTTGLSKKYLRINSLSLGYLYGTIGR